MTKIPGLRLPAQNNSGIILLVVLWSLVVIAIMAITLARGTQMELAMARNAVGKVQSQYLAWAGVMYAVELVRQDSDSDDDKDSDSLYLCGISSEGMASLEDRFKDISAGNGVFSIGYEEFVSSAEEKTLIYGMQDTARYLNLNLFTVQTAPILSALIKNLNVDAQTADEIAYSVVDWVDADDVQSHSDYGAESDHYEEEDPAYTVKNKPFDSVEELRLVRGMTDEIFKAVKPFVTVYPKQGSFKVNFDTAPYPVLLALAHSVSGNMTNTEIADAETLVGKMIEHRNGDDMMPGTQDDREIDLNAMLLNLKERTIFLALNGYRTKRSDIFNVHVLARTENYGVETEVNAVITREDLTILGWSRK